MVSLTCNFEFMFFDSPVRRVSRSFNEVIKLLIISDLLVWSGANLAFVVFPIFVVNQLNDGSLESAGLASMIYMVVSSVATVPFGMIMDKLKGYADEVHFLFIGTLVRGVVLFLFAYIQWSWQLYILQAILGVSRAALTPAWRILFAKYADENKAASQWSFYDAVVTIGMGLAAYLGSFIAEEVSMSFTFQLVGIATVLGAIMTFFLKMYIPSGKQKKLKSRLRE